MSHVITLQLLLLVAPTPLLFSILDTHLFADGTNGFPSDLLQNNDQFGGSLALVPDRDGDGVPELLVGTLYDDDGSADSGALYTLYLDDAENVKSVGKISLLSGNGEKIDISSGAHIGSLGGGLLLLHCFIS